MATKKLAPVHCRVCKGTINRMIELEGDDWVMPSKNFFYHTKCYNSWAKKKDDIHAKATDDEWYESMIYYLNHVVKAPMDYKKIKSQWNTFLKQKTKTAKGIYLAVKYFYEIQKGDKMKSQGGIGIVSCIYEDSCQYWRNREKREAGICDRIEQQIKEFAKQKWVKVKVEEVNRKKEAQEELFAALAKLEDEEE